MKSVAYLSLGSNIGNRKVHLDTALERLSERGRLLSVSSFYETEPVEFTDQGWFLNCVAALETEEPPLHLISALLQIEKEMGRVRGKEKGPRIIDIDILMYGDQVVEMPQLTIPHPAMTKRRFVLEPLAEIAPDLQHPISRKTIREILAALAPGQKVNQISSEADAGQRPKSDTRG